ncbi:MAG: FG-GAP repeat domain-containing protein [Planctomycetota bacterium]
MSNEFIGQNVIVLVQKSFLTHLLIFCMVLTGCTVERPTVPVEKVSEAPEPAPKAETAVTPSSKGALPEESLSFLMEPKLKRTDLPEPTEKQISQAENLVMGACSRCHSPLPADALPKAAWEKVILSMAEMTGPWDQPAPTPEELAIALYWYEREAPESLELVRHPAEEELQFEVIGLTPRGLEKERIPAVSDIMLLKGERGVPQGILISELRSRRLMAIPYGSIDSGALRPFMGPVDFNYPAAISHGDYNNDRKLDIFVASLGGMNPTDEEKGGVSYILSEDGGWRTVSVPVNLGRACDIDVADLDLDGDTDMVVCAFGFRGPGKLLWLKNIQDQFVVKTLDERDGFVAAILDDVDDDEDEDIIALLSQEHEVLIQFTNEGDGSFTMKELLRLPHAAWGSSDLIRVDIDRDGDRDLLLVNGDTLDDHTPKPVHGVRWLERVGKEFVGFHEILLLPGCERAAVGDLDGDGDYDVVGAAFMPQIPSEDWEQWDSLVWAENLGDSKAWDVKTLEVGNPVHSAVHLDDLDRDGNMDIVTGNYVWIRGKGEDQIRRDYLTVWKGQPRP